MSVKKECTIGEEWDSLLNECVVVSCASQRACKKEGEQGTMCRVADPPRLCIRAPCPQYSCILQETEEGGQGDEKGIIPFWGIVLLYAFVAALVTAVIVTIVYFFLKATERKSTKQKV